MPYRPTSRPGLDGAAQALPVHRGPSAAPAGSISNGQARGHAGLGEGGVAEAAAQAVRAGGQYQGLVAQPRQRAFTFRPRLARRFQRTPRPAERIKAQALFRQRRHAPAAGRLGVEQHGQIELAGAAHVGQLGPAGYPPCAASTSENCVLVHDARISGTLQHRNRGGRQALLTLPVREPCRRRRRAAWSAWRRPVGPRGSRSEPGLSRHSASWPCAAAAGAQPALHVS